MSISAVAGPLVTFGQSTYSAIEYNGEAAPSMFYNGSGILDPRQPYTYTPGQDMGQPICGFLGVNDVVTLNCSIAANSATAIAASATVAAATAMTLVSSSSASTGVATGVAIARADTGVLVTGLLAVDAYTSVSGYISNGTSGTAGNLLIITAQTAPQLCIGMVISGTGIAAGTVITGYGPNVGTGSANAAGTGFAGVYTVSGAPVAAGTSGSPITITATAGSSTISGVIASRQPFGQVGSVQLWNPQALCARALIITPSTTTTAAVTFAVSGYDVYGYPMTENIIVPTSSSSAVTGLKAFKYIASITPSTSGGAVSYSVGTSLTLGLPLRTDNFGDTIIYYAAASLTAPTLVTGTTGYTAAVTSTATGTGVGAGVQTTGDVRGTYVLQSAPTTGSARLIVRQSPLLYNVPTATGLFGVTQA
jgi:hypothetical protein